MILGRKTLNNILLAALLFTTAGVILGFSKSLMRGYVVVRFLFLALGASLFSAGIIANLWGDRKTLKDNKLFLAVLGGQAFALAVSVLLSGMPWVSLLGSVPRMMGSLTYWACLITAAATVFAIDGKTERFYLVLRVLMITAVVVALHAFLEVPSVRGFRPPGLLGNPNFLGNWLVVIVMTGFCLMMAEKSRGWSFLSGVSSSLALIALIFSQTRGAWLGLAISLILAGTMMRFPEHDLAKFRRRSFYWTLFTVSATLLLLGVYEAWGPDGVRTFVERSRPGAPERIFEENLQIFHGTTRTAATLCLLTSLVFSTWIQVATRWKSLKPSHKHGLCAVVALCGVSVFAFLFATPSGKVFRRQNLRLEFQNEGRTIVWRDSLHMVKDYWYKGCGIETFRVAFLPYKSLDLAINGPKQNWRNPHNVILYELTSNGILGLLTYLLLIGYAISRFLKAGKTQDGFGMVITGCMASFCGYLVHNLVNYDVVTTAFTMYLFVGLAQAGWSMPENTPAEETDPSSQKTVKSRKKTFGRRRTANPIFVGKKDLVISLVFLSSWFVPFLMGLLWRKPGGWWMGWLGAVPAVNMTAFMLRKKTTPEYPVKKGLLETGFFTTFWLPISCLVVGPEWITLDTQRDPLPLLLSLAITSVFLVITAGPVDIWRTTSSGNQDAERPDMTKQSALVTVLVSVFLFVGAAIYSSKHVINDWGLQRSKIYSTAVERSLLPNLEQIQKGIAILKTRIKEAEESGAPKAALDKARNRLSELHKKQSVQLRQINTLKDKVVHNGRLGTRHFRFMGHFHHQYSKNLQPFLRNPGTIPEAEAEKLMMEAIKHSKQAVRNNTNPESAYSHLAVMHYWSIRFCGVDSKGMTLAQCEQNRLEKSKTALKTSMDYDSLYYDTNRMMAFILAREGDLDGAVRQLKKAKRIVGHRLHRFPTVAQVDTLIKRLLLEEGSGLAQQGRYKEAMVAYKKAIERYGDDMPEAHHLIGVLNVRMKDYRKAEESFKKALDYKRDHPESIVELARLRFLEKRFSDGYALLKKVLEPKVRQPEGLLVRAWAMEVEGNKKQALADLKLYLKLAPTSRQASEVRQKIRSLLSQ